VLRAVGLIGDGEIGDRKHTGDLRESEGLDACAVETLRDNFGFMLREASILAVVIEKID